jgi:hypothetical protein
MVDLKYVLIGVSLEKLSSPLATVTGSVNSIRNAIHLEQNLLYLSQILIVQWEINLIEPLSSKLLIRSPFQFH